MDVHRRLGTSLSAAQDDGFEHIERLARILSGIHEAAAYEHVIVLLVRELEAAAVHVPPDGSAWYGTTRTPASINELGELVKGVATDDERDATEVARSFQPTASAVPTEELLAGVLWSLADPISCELAVLLARDTGDAPAWLAARFEAGKVRYLETQADAFNRDLLRLHDFTTESVDESPIPKPSLRASEAGASYSLHMSPEAKATIKQQEEAFRRKFGRDMGPGDPVFFDPEADTPQPFSPEAIKDIEAQMGELGFNEEWFIRNKLDSRRRACSSGRAGSWPATTHVGVAQGRSSSAATVPDLESWELTSSAMPWSLARVGTKVGTTLAARVPFCPLVSFQIWA